MGAKIVGSLTGLVVKTGDQKPLKKKGSCLQVRPQLGIQTATCKDECEPDIDWLLPRLKFNFEPAQISVTLKYLP